MTTTTGTFPLFISADPYDEPIRLEVEVTAEITEAIPERERSDDCAGEPAVDGRAEITNICFCQPSKKISVPPMMWESSWLLDIIPQATLDRWAAKLYENYSPADDRADWERDQERGQEAVMERFRSIPRVME